MSRIVVLGDLNLDVHARAPSELAPGEESRNPVRATPGGSAGTFARIAAAQGASVAFIGCVGADLVGDLLVRSLEDAGVDAMVQRSDRPSGVILSLEQGTERTMICSRGANDGIRAARIAASAFDDAGHLHVSGYAFLSSAQRPAVERTIHLARERALTISVDPPPANLIRDHGVEAFSGAREPQGRQVPPLQTPVEQDLDKTDVVVLVQVGQCDRADLERVNPALPQSGNRRPAGVNHVLAVQQNAGALAAYVGDAARAAQE